MKSWPPLTTTTLVLALTHTASGNCIVEASAPTIILFSVIRKDVDNLYKRQIFRPRGFHQSQILHADEGLGAEKSSIYINYQHLVDYTKENNCGNAHLNYTIS